jgi:hypothetical protein
MTTPTPWKADSSVPASSQNYTADGGAPTPPVIVPPPQRVQWHYR